MKTGQLCFIDTVGMSGGGGGKIIEDNGQGPAAESRAIPGLLKSKVTAVAGVNTDSGRLGRICAEPLVGSLQMIPERISYSQVRRWGKGQNHGGLSGSKASLSGHSLRDKLYLWFSTQLPKPTP